METIKSKGDPKLMLKQNVGLSEAGNVTPGKEVTISAMTDIPFSKIKFVSNGDIDFNPVIAKTDSQGVATATFVMPHSPIELHLGYFPYE